MVVKDEELKNSGTIARFIITFRLVPLPLNKSLLISTTVIDAMHSCTLQPPLSQVIVS